MVSVKSVESPDTRSNEVMLKDTVVGIALLSHDRSPDLAHSYTVTPAGTVKDELIGEITSSSACGNDKRRTIEMRG